MSTVIPVVVPPVMYMIAPVRLGGRDRGNGSDHESHDGERRGIVAAHLRLGSTRADGRERKRSDACNRSAADRSREHCFLQSSPTDTANEQSRERVPQICVTADYVFVR
jgi:hypothetical protein